MSPLYFSCWRHKLYGSSYAIDRKLVREKKLPFEAPYLRGGLGVLKNILLDNISLPIRNFLETES